MKKFKGHIFDVGANDGTDGLAIAIKNKDFFVHAFEANPYLIKEIKKLKKKIEFRKRLKILNYKINSCAVGNIKKISTFYISVNHRVSSLNKLSSGLDNSWPGYKDSIFKVIKKIKVKVINLNDYMKKNKINNIRYLHIDTQGNDLNVLKGLKSNINNVDEGKMEAAINKKNAAYKNNHTIKDVKKKIFKSKLKIYNIVKIEHLSGKKIFKNEADIFFRKKKISKIDSINLNYNHRYYGRLISNKTYFKDDVFDFFIRLKNFLIKSY